MDKAAFKKEAKIKVNELVAKLEKLEADKNLVSANAKAEYEEKLTRIKTQKDELESKYEELVDASEDKWEEAKTKFSSASDSFKEGFSKIASLIS